MTIERLLAQRADLWRGHAAPLNAPAGVPSGFTPLDAALTWHGWPPGSLSEILTGHQGAAFGLLLPMLTALSRQPRWLLLVEPPFVPYAPALAAHGVDVGRLVVVHAGDALPWAMEQGLRSGACAAVLGWSRARDERGWSPAALRRLQLAADAGDALALLLRSTAAARQPSPAALRLAVQAAPNGLLVELLKQRGGQAGVRLTLTRPGAAGSEVERAAERDADPHTHTPAVEPARPFGRSAGLGRADRGPLSIPSLENHRRRRPR